MNTRIKSFFKGSLSVVLSLLIMLSTILIASIVSANATTYYYRGAKNSWGATAMTTSSDGYYAYYSATGGAHQFKISTSTTSYDYNYTYVSASYNGTNVSEIGDYNSDNCYCWKSSAHYILVYFPNTHLNTTNKPVICASTTLPDNTDTAKLAYDVGNEWTSGDYNCDHYVNMTRSGSTYTYSMMLTKSVAYHMFIQTTPNSSNYYYYKPNSMSTMTTSTSVSLVDKGSSNYGNTANMVVFTPSAGGNYTFTWNASTSKLSVSRDALPTGAHKIGDDITTKWDSNATNSMTGTGSSHTFVYYLKNTDADVYFRPYSTGSSLILGSLNEDQVVTTSYTSDTKISVGTTQSFKLVTSNLTAGKYSAVTITYDSSQNSGEGAVKYSAAAQDNLTALLDTNKSSYNITSGSGGLTLTATASNLFNSSNVTYQFYRKKGSGSWSSLGSASSTATYSWSHANIISAGTGNYQFKVKVVDTTVNTSTNARTARYVESEPIDITVVEGQTYQVNKAYQFYGSSAVSDGTTEIGDTDARATTLTFPLYKNDGNVRKTLYDITATSGITIKTKDVNAGTASFYTSAAGGTITAIYKDEAPFRQLYFKKPSGWNNTLYAYLWKSTDDSVKNNTYGGAAIPDGAYQAAEGARSDAYGQCDFVGSLHISTGATASSEDIYYYYKTYCSDYDRMIFNDNGSTSLKTNTLWIDTSSLSNSNNYVGTYTANSMYYDTSDSKWHPLPAAKFNVAISATDSSVDRVNNNGAASATGTVSVSSVAVNSGTSATVTLYAPDGYEIASTAWNITGNVTVTLSASTSNTQKTYTITATGHGSISPNFKEIRRTITVKKRVYPNVTNPTPTVTTVTTYTAGISSYVTIAQPAATSNDGDYEWSTYTLENGINNYSGATLTSRAALNVKAKASGTYTVYEDYTEALHTLTIQRNYTARGSVLKNNAGSNVNSVQVGNVTYVSLTASNNSGYAFDFWEITPGSGNTVTIYDGTNTSAISAATGSTAPADGNIRKNSTLQFRINGDSTVKAHFREVDYSISADFDTTNGAYTTNQSSGNWKKITNASGTEIQDGKINSTFQIRLLIASGYELDEIRFATGGTGGNGITNKVPKTGVNTTTGVSTATPTTSNGWQIYEYTLDSGNAVATIKLKAVTPTLTAYMKNNTAGFATYTSSSSATMSVNNYYRQPADLKADTDSFATISYTVNGTAKDSGLSYLSTSNNKSYNNPADDKIPTTVSGTKTYNVVVTATNSQPGVDTATTTCTITVTVRFNAEQKAYFKMKRLYDNTIGNDTAASTYYNSTANLNAFQTARTAANTAYGLSGGTGWPAYNATGTTVQNYYNNNFLTPFKNLQQDAKTTTIYILSKYQNNDNSQYMSIYTASANTADYNHFKQYHYYLNEIDAATYVKSENNHQHHLMRYEGSVQNSGGTTLYLYSFTYAGRTSAQIYYSSTKTSTTYTDRLLTTSIAKTSINGFTEYYISQIGNYSSSGTTITVGTNLVTFVPIKNRRTTEGVKVKCDISNDEYDDDDISDLIGLYTEGSLKDTSSIPVTVTEFKIQKNPGKNNELINLLNNEKWQPKKAGRYTVTYKTQYKAASDNITGGGAAFVTTNNTFYIYVAYDEVTVYIDMNNNVGNPRLLFTYYVNSSGTPVASGTSGASERTLPFDMSLVTGSDTVYSYKVNLKNLSDKYKIAYKSGTTYNAIPFKIKLDTNSTPYESADYKLYTDSYDTGTVWFKADSTSLSKFEPISNAPVTTTFRAVDNSGNYLGSAESSAPYLLHSAGISLVQGTGIVNEKVDEDGTFFDGIYEVLYAAYENDAEAQVHKDFTYNVKVTAEEEVTVDSTTYYFDRWVKVRTPDELTINGTTHLPSSVDLTGLAAISEDNVYSIHKRPVYGEEDGEGDYTYVAVYKVASTAATDVRVKVTYNFKDYDTSDGNYVYDKDYMTNGNDTDDDMSDKTVDATYTKTFKVPLGQLYSGTNQTYANYAAVYNQTAINAIVGGTNIPIIVSNYFDYAFESANIIPDYSSQEVKSDSSKNLIVVNATLTATPHVYYIKKDTSTYPGYFQQTKELTDSATVWQVKFESGDDSENAHWATVASGTATYEARFGMGGPVSTTTFVRTVASGSTANTAVITPISNVVYNDGKSVHHNYYILDFAQKGKLVGAGVLYATTDASGNYRTVAANQQSTHPLYTSASAKTFVESILTTDAKFQTEYPAQSISNVGFRYMPYNGNEEILRYSTQLGAYNYIFEANNTVSSTYEGQKLRVYAFYVYDNSGTNTVVVSDQYAELSRNP